MQKLLWRFAGPTWDPPSDPPPALGDGHWSVLGVRLGHEEVPIEGDTVRFASLPWVWRILTLPS